MKSKKTWLLLGASGAIGRAFARQAAKQGDDIVLLGKDKADLDLTADDLRARYPAVSVAVEELETSNLEAFEETVEKCKAKAKNPLSVFSALETVYTQKECGKDLGKIKNMFQVNYFSQVYFLSAVAPFLTEQRGGKVIVLGSTAGDYGSIEDYGYGSTKAALHVWLQGFQADMAASGVSVTTVKVGDLDSLGERKNWAKWIPVDIDSCAKACLKYAESGAKVRYFPWYACLTTLRRFIPKAVWEKMKRE